MASILRRETGQREIRYRAQVRIKGYPPQCRTFERRKDAIAWARDREAELKTGRGAGSWAEDHLFAELVDRFEAKVLPGMPRIDHGYRAHLRWWRKELGKYFLKNITVSVIWECRERLLREKGSAGRVRGRATVNRYLTALSTVLRLGEKLEWIDANLVRKVGKETEPDGRVRFLSRPEDERDSELVRLIAACERSECADLADLVKLALYTGCRANELLSLRSAYVRVEAGGFTLPAELSKNGEARFVPLAGEAMAIVRRRLGRTDEEADLIFPGRDGAPRAFPRNAWERALEEAKIKNFRFHDLRHTHASYLAMMGATASELKETLGHKTLAMVGRYAHLADDHKSRVSARLAAQVEWWVAKEFRDRREVS
ncbi:MAG TPA: site-specific integrase [Thermoanaerobaculia bacterium]|nr:site-specific integrase [Thermoanaerobaculia bacterium]